MLKHTLGSIVFLLSPLSTLSLSRLLHLQKEEIDQTLEELYAILDILEDSTRPLRLHHPSFRDFLINKDRCGDFWVDEKQAHKVLAVSCIQLMSQTLKKDICEMHAPGSQASQIESSRVQKYLSYEIQYACLYWVQHLQRSSAQLWDSDQVHQFLQAHLLHWLEALSWIGKSSEGILAILSLETLVSVGLNPTLHAFIYDAKRFALYNQSVIEQAPLQLYCSALIFTSEKSIVRRQFEKDIPHWIEMKPRVQANWNAAVHEGHSGAVWLVAFSPDGKLVVSGADDDTVRLWDAKTGAARQTLRGHSRAVSSVAFSPDGKLVVSGSYDETVRLWDTETGASRQTLKGHSHSVKSIAFASDGELVDSESDDDTVRLWGAKRGVRGHSRAVSSVAFSTDGTLVVSGSYDDILQLWDAATGTLQQALNGHPDMVNSVNSIGISSNGKAHGMVVSDKWIADRGANILWLPLDYRATSTAVWERDSSIVLGHSSGNVSIFKFTPSPKAI